MRDGSPDGGAVGPLENSETIKMTTSLTHDDAQAPLRIIDADTHVTEPLDLWTSRLSTEKWGNLIPHVRFDEDAKEEVWYFGDKKIYAAGLASGASWTEYPPDHPKKLADSPVRNYDPVKRLEHMDEYGIQPTPLSTDTKLRRGKRWQMPPRMSETMADALRKKISDPVHA